jgi:hypothetical protein
MLGDPGMKRFFFNLCGALRVDDRLGIRFETPLQAFRVARTMARDLSNARPALRGKAWLVLACENSEDAYCLAIDGEDEALELEALELEALELEALQLEALQLEALKLVVVDQPRSEFEIVRERLDDRTESSIVVPANAGKHIALLHQ